MASLKDILDAEALEVSALQGLKAAVNAVPPAIKKLQDQVAAGSAVTAADLDGVVAAMHSATSEIAADATTLTDATTEVPPTPAP